MIRSAFLTVIAVLTAMVGSVSAQLPPADNPTPEPATAQPPAPIESDAIAFRVEKPRSTNNKIILASMLGATTLIGGIGLAFHLDSRDKSNEVSQLGELSGLAWTEEREATRKSALKSRNFAIAAYSVGGAALIATAVYYVVSEPGEEVLSVTGLESTTPIFAISGEDAVLGAQWSFR